MKRFVALTVAGALTLASLAGCQKASTAEKQPAGGETTESQAENGGNEKKSTDAKLLKTSMPTAWDETHGYTQALIAMNAYLDEASGVLSTAWQSPWHVREESVSFIKT